MRRRYRYPLPGEATPGELYASLTGQNVPTPPVKDDRLGSPGQLLFVLVAFFVFMGVVVVAWYAT